MTVTCVHVYVKPNSVEAFIEACKKNHLASVKEPGNLRFDVLQDDSDATKFLLYEAYETPEAAAAHKNTAHYAEWRDKVADMMAKPREGVKHTAIFLQ